MSVYKRLGVNIDHVATLRQARGTRYPDPLFAALLAEKAGADQITLHLREDRRHIQDHDVVRVRESIQTKLNLEMALSDEMMAFALRLKPDTVTFVPEKREERTTEGGLDVDAQLGAFRKATQQLRDAGIDISFFIEPSLKQARASKELGATAVELHTGHYCDTTSPLAREDALMKLDNAAKMSKSLGLRVYAGHGLNLLNIPPILKIQEIEEFNIGHSLVAHALFVGFEEAVREMKTAIRTL